MSDKSLEERYEELYEECVNIFEDYVTKHNLKVTEDLKYEDLSYSGDQLLFMTAINTAFYVIDSDSVREALAAFDGIKQGVIK